jgi:hypothetical protein
MIDTLKLSRSLIYAGMPPEQAEAITLAINDELIEIRKARSPISPIPRLKLGVGRSLLLLSSGFGTGVVVAVASSLLFRLGMYAFSLCR